MASYRVLILSYEFIKPEYPDIHYALAQWVQDGGALIYVGDDSDPYHNIRAWWNPDRKEGQSDPAHNSPRAHLFEQLGLKDKREGINKVGKGIVCWLNEHPADFTLSKAGADRLRQSVKETMETLHGPELEWKSKPYFKIRRGPYLIVSILDESVSEEQVDISGLMVDLFDSQLSVLSQVALKPGEQALLYDIEAGRPTDGEVSVIAASSRIEGLSLSAAGFRFIARGPANMKATARLYCRARPLSAQYVVQERTAPAVWEWDPDSKTVLLQYEHGDENNAEVSVRWTS
ncbi:hypothetical protein [Paenibacillus sp. 1A_MP2]|uniref:hypothetical protein n=1 Tax=Paenibacillus sp. 1A_MP2 TaxID=3457495 RepID=UPI003FCD5EA2